MPKRQSIIKCTVTEIQEVCHRGGHVLAFERMTRVRVPAAQSARVFKRIPLKSREQGMPDARCTRGPVRKGGIGCAHEHTGQRRQSDIPCAMALRLITSSPRRSAFLPPSPLRSLLLKNLTPAPRRQDHTSLPYAIRAFVLRAHRVHRIPPQRIDDRDTPLVERMRRRGYSGYFGITEAKYFCFRGLTRVPKIGNDLPDGKRH